MLVYWPRSSLYQLHPSCIPTRSNPLHSYRRPKQYRRAYSCFRYALCHSRHSWLVSLKILQRQGQEHDKAMHGPREIQHTSKEKRTRAFARVWVIGGCADSGGGCRGGVVTGGGTPRCCTGGRSSRRGGPPPVRVHLCENKLYPKVIYPVYEYTSTWIVQG